jgi:hypothetical protein
LDVEPDDPRIPVKELLGHSSVSVTMRYVHTNRDAKTRVLGLIAGNGAKLVTPGMKVLCYANGHHFRVDSIFQNDVIVDPHKA